MMDEHKSWFRRHWILSIIFGFFAFIFIIGILAGMFGGNTNSPNSVSKNSEKIFALNEPASVDYLTYKVIKIESFNEMGSSVFNKKTEGKYIKVYLEILNNAPETKQIFTPRFTIIDGQNRKFERVTDDMLYIADYLELGKQLQPGLKTSGAIVFELPSDSVNLVLSIRGDWTSTSEIKVSLSNINNIGKDVSLQNEIDASVNDALNSCNAPFVCSASCQEYMDVGVKNCPSGQVCCMQS